MGKVRAHFAFLSVLVFIFHFVLLALNCAHMGALQYWLGYVCSLASHTLRREEGSGHQVVAEEHRVVR